MTEAEKSYRVVSLGKGTMKVFLVYTEENNTWWCDLSKLPHACFLCACYDGASIMQYEVEDGVKKEFVTFDWLSKEWGGDKHMVAAVKGAIDRVKDD